MKELEVLHQKVAVLVAVSYTHLDVYKRQVVATVGCMVHPINGDAFEIKKAKIRGEESEGTVSYTHLDVYKRQEYGFLLLSVHPFHCFQFHNIPDGKGT